MAENDPRTEKLTISARLTYTKLAVGENRQVITEDTATVKKTALMKHATNGVIKLHQEDLEIVSHYLHWARTGGANGGKICSRVKLPTTTTNDEEFELLVHLYCFGEKYKDKNFKESVISAFLAKIKVLSKECKGGKCWLPPLSATTYLFDNTPVDSPMRKLIKDVHQRGNPDQLKNLTEGDGAALCFLEVIGQFAEEAGRKALPALDREHYHEK